MSLTDTYIVFELNQAAYAVKSEYVQHVEMLEHLTAVPNTAPAVEGVVFSRGQVIPAISLRKRFGLAAQQHTARTRLIYLRVRDRLVALIVDAAKEFEHIPADSIRPIQETLVGIEGNYVEGVVTIKGRNILILDVRSVLTLEEITTPAGAELTSSAGA